MMTDTVLSGRSRKRATAMPCSSRASSRDKKSCTSPERSKLAIQTSLHFDKFLNPVVSLLTGAETKKARREENRKVILIGAEEVELSADVALPRPLLVVEGLEGRKDPELKEGGHLNR